MDSLHMALTFLLAAAGISLAAAYVRVPYTIALVVVGLALGHWHLGPSVTVTPEALFLALIVPLLFDGGLHLPLRDLRTYAGLIGSLAVIGTVLAAVVIGGAALFIWHLPVRTALLLGAIASAIDPVSVIALVREAALDRRLGTILEAEAVFNDGVAIVLFSVASAPHLPGLGSAVWQFIWLLGGGAVAGGLVALGVSLGLSRIREPLVELLGSLVLAIAAFLAADAIGGSGVIAVVAAGIVLGNCAPRVLSTTGQETLRTVWEVITYLANSALFLVIGMAILWQPLIDLAGVIAVVVLAAFAARAAGVYGLATICGRFLTPIPRAWQHVLVWGGLRGGVAIALVLALPRSLPGRDTVTAAVYGLVVFTLLAQGLTTRPLLRRFGLPEAL